MGKKARKTKHSPLAAAASRSASVAQTAEGKTSFVSFIDKALSWGLGLLCLFVSISFYTGLTYDTAYVKITLLQTGATALIALWLSLLLVQKRCPVTRQNLPWLLPFLIYFGWNFLGYALSDYKAEGFDEFFRYVLYFMLGLMVLDRFTRQSVRIVSKCIVLAAWISCLYGLVQILDRWLPGLDFLMWRGYFGTRIFSTHANPNFFADFVLFSSFIVLAEFLRTRQKRLLLLLGAAAVNLFFTESKGAWLGFAAAAAFCAALYTNGIGGLAVKTLRKVNIAAAALLLGAVLLAGAYASKRFQSVSFRAYTWSSTFAMVQDSPVIGTGLGSFKTIYPAYRKPQIFYIEKMHNNETQHAENEYLEQWATAGTVGLAVFLWLLFFVLYAAGRHLALCAAQARAAGRKPSGQTWWLLGYSAALFGMLVHNFFDISMRFASSGLFFAVFCALLLRLCMPERETEPEPEPDLKPAPVWWIRCLQLALFAGVLYLAGYYIYMFAQVAGHIGVKNTGDGMLRITAWIVLCALTFLGAWTYMRAAFLARWARVPALLLLSILPLQWVFGFFVSDHCYGMATEFTRLGMSGGVGAYYNPKNSAKAQAVANMLDGALEYYTKAIRYNPFVAAYYQYRAYVLRTTMNMQRVYAPIKGDAKPRAGEEPLNDYERVLRDLDVVRRRSPNHALLHQTYGEFYYGYAVYYTELSKKESLAYQRREYEKEAVKNMELAKKSFQRSLLLDPVNEATYMFLISIAMMERDPAGAQAWIDAYRRGPEGVTEPEFLQTHKHNARIDAQERRLRQPPFNYFPPEENAK